ncbi:hypothetical protein PspLS_08650 [Pyricularia sp. CBS 133598]|nr:hypothetical protein PspLS_08650 [Pyricularia sp. CBS 133598]
MIPAPSTSFLPWWGRKGLMVRLNDDENRRLRLDVLPFARVSVASGCGADCVLCSVTKLALLQSLVRRGWGADMVLLPAKLYLLALDLVLLFVVLDLGVGGAGTLPLLKDGE